jgi:hypothetical protein
VTLWMLMLLWATVSALGLAASAWMVIRGWAGSGNPLSFAAQNRAPG